VTKAGAAAGSRGHGARGDLGTKRDSYRPSRLPSNTAPQDAETALKLVPTSTSPMIPWDGGRTVLGGSGFWWEEVLVKSGKLGFSGKLLFW